MPKDTKLSGGGARISNTDISYISARNGNGTVSHWTKHSLHRLLSSSPGSCTVSLPHALLVTQSQSYPDSRRGGETPSLVRKVAGHFTEKHME